VDAGPVTGGSRSEPASCCWAAAWRRCCRPASALGPRGCAARRSWCRGDPEDGPIGIVEHGELPSAGDTSYAGVARIRGSRFVTTWYSSPPAEDPSWLVGFGGRTDIWKAELDLSRLRR
jgi:hypothetical protein